MEEAAASPLLDPDTLRDLDQALGPAFVAECITVYLDDADRLRAGIEAALSAGDGTELVRAAHALGSASATIGAAALSRLCRRIEKEGADGSTAAELKETYTGAVTALRSERDQRLG
jgi:HPt (histidine-containing phosphotransfer) domain-containing protein